MAAPALASVTFTGKITEIRRATELGLNQKDVFYIIKLDTKAHEQFRISTDEAVAYGLVEQGGPSQVVTPRQAKGLGWKVRLTCDSQPTGPVKTPVYRVKTLERLDD